MTAGRLDPRHDAGAVVALLDRAMRDAAEGRAAGADVAPVDIHVVFLHDGGAPVTAAARVCGGGKSVCFCEAEITDAGGRVVARAMGTFRQRGT
jgi:acyl-coenzyme A thioesterase PaaI-like protein